MTIMRRMNPIPMKYLGWPMLLLLLTFNSGMAQQVFNYLPTATPLDAEQQHYLSEAESWPYTGKYRLVKVDMSTMENDRVLFNCLDGVNLYSDQMKRDNRALGDRISWIGEFPGHPGNVHAVYRISSDEMVAHIQYEDLAYLLRPLGGGVHALFEYDMTMDDGCQTSDRQSNPPRPVPREEGVDRNNPDVNTALDDSGNDTRSTGECNIRVYVVYTAAAASAVTDIMSDITNMFNTANTGYQNSGITYSHELAAAELIAYTQSGDMQVDLDNITGTSDGNMDGVHASRILWEADQVALLTSTGSGIAWLSSAYSDQFSVTGVPNFYAHTFQHELGHNALCTHAINQSVQPGSSPYAGWGEPTTGCFRTVMAYGDACGTGGCPRHNIFSDNDAGSWLCGGTNYMPGTADNRNQDRLVLSRSTMVAHNVVNSAPTYTANYTWSDNEAVHMAGNNTLTYSSATNAFVLNSGSEGSFRASDAVTLGTGFWAKSGTVFTAYLESCASLRIEGPDNPPLSDDEVEDVDLVTMDVRPNPFASATDVVINVMGDDQVLDLVLYDLTGRVAMTLASKTTLASGTHVFHVNADELSAGTYLVRVVSANGFIMLSKMVIRSH